MARTTWKNMNKVGRKSGGDAGSIALEKRFWARSEPEPNSGCWLWTGALFNTGYGKVFRKLVFLLAHRVAWELRHGPIPSDLNVCHRCDVPRCVNPQHLFLGTDRDNQQDSIGKGRRSRTDGDHNGRAKLTRQDISKIRERFHSGTRVSALAREFGVAWSTMKDAVTGEHWK